MFPSPLALPPPCCTSGESDVTEKEMREREREKEATQLDEGGGERCWGSRGR